MSKQKPQTKKEFAIDIVNKCHRFLTTAPLEEQTSDKLEIVISNSEKSLQILPNNPEAYRAITFAQEKLKRYQEAFETSKRWVATIPPQENRRINYAKYSQSVLLIQLGLKQEAVQIYNDVIESERFQNNPDSEIYFLRALTNYAIGEVTNTIRDLSLSILEDPDNLNARLQRAKVNFQEEYLEFALHDYKVLHQSFPESIDYLEAIITCSLGLKDVEQCKKYGRKLDALYPGAYREILRDGKELH